MRAGGSDATRQRSTEQMISRAAMHAFWTKHLRGCSIEPSLSGSEPDAVQRRAIVPEVTRRLYRLSGNSTVGVHLVVTAAVRLAVARLTGNQDVVVRCPAPGTDGEIALRRPLDPDEPVSSFLRGLHEELTRVAAYPWRDRGALAERLAASAAADSAVLDQLVVIHDPTRTGNLADAGLVVRAADDPSAGGMSIVFSARPGRAPAQLPALATATALVLADIAERPHLRAGEVTVVGQEHAALLRRWSGLPLTPAVRDSTLPELVAEAGARHPDRVAIEDPTGSLSYRELVDDGLATAAALVADHGVASGDRVAVMLPRGRDFVCAVLGVLAAGAVCVPVDPDHPAARVRDQLDGAEVSLLLCADPARQRWSPVRTVPWAPPRRRRGSPTAEAIPGGARPSDDAFVLFTSGSTGEPKATAIRHDQLCHKVLSSAELIGLGRDTRCALLSALTSDATLYQVFATLGAGGTVVAVGNPLDLDPVTFWDRLRAAEVNTLNCVPSLLDAMLGGLRPGAGFPLAHLMLGGDTVSTELIRRAGERLRIGRFVNFYGPTEATIDATTFVRDGTRLPALSRIPLGRPSPGFGVLVLTPSGELAPEGVDGEIHIAGDGVVRGYLNAPEATAERFADGPLPGIGRTFRTGDRGRWRDGELEFLGRRDRQVQVNGTRVELGEVEAAVLRAGPVRECAVFADTVGTAGRRLVACVVAEDGLGDLRGALVDALPPQLVPAEIHRLPELPRTPHGKLDTAALRQQLEQSTEETQWAPEDGIERLVARVWREVLGRPARSADEDFLAVGGQSLAAAHLVARLCAETDSVALSVRDVFTARSPRAVAAAVRAARDRSTARPTAPVTPPARGSRRLPASNAQRRMWVLEQAEEGQLRPYTMVEAYEFDHDVDESRLAAAVRDLVARHEALRTTLVPTEDGLDQVIRPPEEVDVTLVPLPVPAIEPALSELFERELRTPFDLGEGPLLRVRLMRAPDEPPVLLLTTHHAVCDGWSVAVLLRDLVELMRPRPELPEPVQYADCGQRLTERLNGPEGHEDRSFWHGLLADPPERADLPTDRYRPRIRSNTGGTVRTALDDETQELLREVCLRTGATPFAVFTAAVRVLLHRLTGGTDVLLGTVVAGRDDAELASAVGLLANTVVLRTPLHPSGTFLALVGDVAAGLFTALEHGQYPFDVLVDELGVSRAANRNPLFDVLVQTVVTGTTPVDPRGAVRHRPLDEPISVFDLSFSLREPDHRQRRAEIWVGYSDDCFDRDTALRILQQCRHVLRELLRRPDDPVVSASILPADQRAFLLDTCNRTRADFPAEHTLLDLFERCAAHSPDLPAVHSGGTTLSYAELDAAVTAVAARLREVADPGPGDLVALVLHRTQWMVIGVLAALRTGAAFLPADPEQGSRRLAHVLDSSGAAVVLADGRHHDAVRPLTSLPVLDPTTVSPDTGPARQARARPEDPAYAIYTSGSTGLPKGVLIEHRGIVNTAHYRIARYGLRPSDCLLQISPVHFDSGLNDLFAMLLSGGSLAVLDRDVLLSPHALAAEIDRRSATIMTLVPSLYELLLDTDVAALRSLRLVVLVGEQITAALARRHAELLPDTRLANEYGPTEDSVWTAGCFVDDEPRRVPIGLPIANKTVDLLDAHGDLVPLGVSGEICVGGIGLARGYLGACVEDAARFTANPVRGGSRMYRTGDLGRRRPDGSIEFVGRIDDQIKIRGQRVEPQEVATVLSEVPGVRNCAVVPWEQDGPPRLVAYVVGSRAPEELRVELARRLPSAMVPATFVAMDELPVNRGGKIDRAALPPPSPPAEPARVAADGWQRSLLDLWERALGDTVADLDASLFELGGHSLTAARITRLLATEYDVDIPLRTVFENQSVREMAAALGELAPPHRRAEPTDGPGTERRSGATAVPLTHAQHRILLSSRISPPNAFNLSDCFQFDGELDIDVLETALRTVLSRHELLGARLHGTGRDATLRLDPERADALPVRVQQLPPDSAVYSSVVKELIDDAAREPFDLTGQWLFRVHALLGASGGDILVIVAHHLIFDGSSVDYLMGDLAAAYHRLSLDEPARITPPEHPYEAWLRDQLSWLDGPEARRQLDFWRDQLATPPEPLALPIIGDRGVRRTGMARVVRRHLGKEGFATIRAIAAEANVTPYMTLATALSATLHRLTGQPEMILGFPAGGRNRPPVVGCFLNAVALRLSPGSARSHDELLTHVRRQVLLSYEHSGVPFDLVVRELRPRQQPGRSLLFDVGVTWENADATQHGQWRQLLEQAPQHIPAQFDLWLYARELGEELVLELAYDRNLLDRELVTSLLSELVATVEVVHTRLPVSTSPLALQDAPRDGYERETSA